MTDHTISTVCGDDFDRVHRECTRDGEFIGSREQWCEAIASVLIPMLSNEQGIEPVGEPRRIKFALAPLPSTTLGICYSAAKSLDGDTNLVTVSTDQGSHLELVHTVLHELLHAFDDCRSGHRGRWKSWAEQIGIETRGHERGPIAEDMVQRALADVGIPVEHVTTGSGAKKPRPKSQYKFICLSCEQHCHIPAKAALEGFSTVCGICSEQMTCPDLNASGFAGERPEPQPEPEPQYTVEQCKSEMQKHHPDKGGDAEQFRIWAERLEQLRQTNRKAAA